MLPGSCATPAWRPPPLAGVCGGTSDAARGRARTNDGEFGVPLCVRLLRAARAAKQNLALDLPPAVAKWASRQGCQLGGHMRAGLKVAHPRLRPASALGVGMWVIVAHISEDGRTDFSCCVGACCGPGRSVVAWRWSKFQRGQVIMRSTHTGLSTPLRNTSYTHREEEQKTDTLAPARMFRQWPLTPQPRDTNIGLPFSAPTCLQPQHRVVPQLTPRVPRPNWYLQWAAVRVDRPSWLW